MLACRDKFSCRFRWMRGLRVLDSPRILRGQVRAYTINRNNWLQTASLRASITYTSISYPVLYPVLKLRMTAALPT
jgi:hypothetical protein